MTKDLMPNQFFWTRDGESAQSLEGLAKLLDNMSEELFSFHTKEHGNDFANWIGNVFGDPDLKRDVRRCMTASEAAKVLREAASKEKPSDAGKPQLNKDASIGANDAIDKNAVNGPGVAENTGPSENYNFVEDNTSDEQVAERLRSLKMQALKQKMGVAEGAANPSSTFASLSDANQSSNLADNGNWDDQHFDPFKKEMTKRVFSLSNRYEEAFTRMQSLNNDPMPQDLEKLGETLNMKYNNLLGRISDKRKSGKDMLFAWLQIRQFPAKLALAKATRNRTDYAIAEQVISQAELLYKEEVEESEVNVESEIIAILAAEDGKSAPKTPNTTPSRMPINISPSLAQKIQAMKLKTQSL